MKSKLRRRSRRSTRKFIKNAPPLWKRIVLPDGAVIDLYLG